MLAQAVALHRQGRLVDAELLYTELLLRQPDNFDALHLSGLVAAQTSRGERAVALITRALEKNDRVAAAHNHLGTALRELGRIDEAAASFGRAIALRPEFLEAHINHSAALLELGRADQALASADQAIAIRPDNSKAHINRAAALTRLKRFGAALSSYDDALALQPDSLDAHLNRGELLLQLGRPAEALSSFDRVIELRPECARAHCGRGAALRELNHASEALTSLDMAIALQPDLAAAHANRAAALQDLQRPAEALSSSEQAIALDPDHAAAHSNRAASLHDLLRPAEAVASADMAILLQPDLADAHVNRGTALQAMARTDEALASHLRAATLDEKCAAAYWNASLCYLQLGQYQEGWRLYEWRQSVAATAPSRTHGHTVWRGCEDLAGKTICLTAEQGLGDTIQFCRYAKLLQQLGAQVILAVQPQLRRLMMSLGADIRIMSETECAPEADYQCRLLSLPLAFRTTLNDIPAQVPYLAAEQQRIAHWRERLGGPGFKIGICWQGSTAKIDLGRSFPLQEMVRLAAIRGIRLISLQKGHGSEQLRAMGGTAPVEILGPEFDHGHDAFLDTAAAMDSLDLVITSDTSVAHLAGALGRPAWVALKHVPDWRWMLDREDSPWYPTLRLFRQRQAGNWHQVFDRMYHELSTQMAGRCS